MSPSAPRPPMIPCSACGAMNDPQRGSTRCRNCGASLMVEITPRVEVVAVPFLDGHIPCVMRGGEPKVFPKPISDLMGLNWAGQYTKLSADQTTCIEFISTQVPGDDQVRKHTIVSLETFTVWLAGLQPSRVRPEVREIVMAYKREAGRALRNHFFGVQRIVEGDELALLEETNGRLARAIEIAKAERAARQEAEAEIAAMTPVVEEHEQIVFARGLIPMSVFAQQSGIIRPNGQPLGEQTANAALRALRILKDSRGTESHNTPYQEHAHRIVTKVERRGPMTVNVPYIVPKHFGYLAGRIDAYLNPGRARLPRPRLGELRAIEGGA